MSGFSLIQQQKLQQKLSPAQIQVVRMLELPACELQQRINEELQENPALDEGKEVDLDNTEETQEGFGEDEEDYTNPLQNDDFNYDDYIEDDEAADYRYNEASTTDYDANKEIPFSVGTSFGEYLKSQVYLTKMDKSDRHIAKFVVGNIDEDGYLRRSPEELVDDLAFREGLNIPDEKMRDIIRQIQRFDPPGVGAKDLQDCLLIQLNQLSSAQKNEAIADAKRILLHCFEDFSHRRFDKICQKFSFSEERFRLAMQEITRLNPKPGSAWQGTVYDRHQTTVIPDFFIENRDGELYISLNQGDIPQLRISPEYTQMLQDYTGNESNRTAEMTEAIRFVRQKIDSARWFIDAIKQRNETLMHTMTAIASAQKEFFLEGDETLIKPLILQDIANQTGYDVSTISRVSNSKFVQTEWGVFPLKYFFSEKLLNTEGEEVSTREIKKRLQELIQQEDKREPLSDDQMVEVMKQNGYMLARRTIAKYRDQLGIPVARLRKEI